MTTACTRLIKNRAGRLGLLSLFPPDGRLANIRHDQQAAGRTGRPLKRHILHKVNFSANALVPHPSLVPCSGASHACTASALSIFDVEKSLLGIPSLPPLPSYALLPRRHLYWPPLKDQRSKRIKLPSGKKCFVFNAKRDQDGKLEPVVCFVDSQDNLLMWFDEEEFLAFESLIPRLQSYYELWEAKAARVEEAESQQEEATMFPSPGLD